MNIDASNIIDYTYDDFVSGIDSIVKQLKEDNFHPDIIVGIVRGGATPAVHLSHKLKVPCHMTHWSLRDSDCVNDPEVYRLIRLGKKILVVDDIVDGGDTIATLLADWMCSTKIDNPLEHVRVAAMWYNPSCGVRINYYDQEIDRNVISHWVVFPWEA